MSFKSLYKELRKELLEISKASFAKQSQKELERQKTLLHYKRVSMLEKGKSTADIDKSLENLQAPKYASLTHKHDWVKDLVAGDKIEGDESATINHLTNVVAFLRSQRIYDELLERYNPGISADQETNVRKTANRVGLAVPERK